MNAATLMPLHWAISVVRVSVICEDLFARLQADPPFGVLRDGKEIEVLNREIVVIVLEVSSR
jgi:hypothetical protein